MKNEFWLIEWQDIANDPDRDIKEIAFSPMDAADDIRRILEGETIVNDSKMGPDGDFPADAERPMFDVMFEGQDPVSVLRELDEPMEQENEQGRIIITHARRMTARPRHRHR